MDTNNNNFFSSTAFKAGFVALCVAIGLAILISAVSGKQGYAGRQGGIDQVPHIAVTGIAERDVTPDLGVFTFEVRKEAAVQSESQRLVNDVLNPLIDKMKAAGVEEKDIRTINGGYATNPVYDYVQQACVAGRPCVPGSQVLRGYETAASIEVKVRDSVKAGELLSLAASNGATSVGSLQFTIDDEQAVYDEVRAEAIDDAREKAEVLADQLGVRLGDIISFSEEGNPIAYPYAYGRGGVMMEQASDSMAGSVPSLPQGQNQFTSRVSVWYEIR